jgi:peptide/nickel transport system ATP-binding protein
MLVVALLTVTDLAAHYRTEVYGISRRGLAYVRVGCKFAGRCPHVMEICRQQDPPDVQVEGRTVKCYLYTEHAEPAPAGEQL